MAAQDYPSDGERQAFVEKLGQFRDTLPPREQRMLDAMTAAAFSPREQGDVQGYGMWVAGPFGPEYRPTFFQTGWRQDWVATPFGPAWQAIPTGYYS